MKEQLKNKKVLLAPLAGVSDTAFRNICEHMGADRTYTEMISCKGLYYGDDKTKDLMYVAESEKNCGVQIFGREYDIMANAVEKYINPRDDIKEISINLGCPAPKIVKNREGSYLLKEPKIVFKILDKINRITDKPLSIKIRLGIENNLNFLEIAKIAEELKLSSVTLHSRTREQYYSGKADWDKIKLLKENLSIPVYGNGDVFSVEDFVSMIETTNCDGVMIARGAMGNPFIFRQIKEYMDTGSYNKVTPSEIIELIKSQYEEAFLYKSEKNVINQMRKHVGWYLKGLANSTKVKNEINKEKDTDKIFLILDRYKKELENYE